MKFKIVSVLFFLFSVQFISSCCKGMDHYDFTKMSVTLSDTLLTVSDSLIINLQAEDLEYVSSISEELSFSSALALSCDHGWKGMKYPLTKFAITSDSNFQVNYPANESLNDLFQLEVFSVKDGQSKYVPFNEVDIVTMDASYVKLLLSERPTESQKHFFEIKLIKSNEEEIVLRTDLVSWN